MSLFGKKGALDVSVDAKVVAEAAIDLIANSAYDAGLIDGRIESEVAAMIGLTSDDPWTEVSREEITSWPTNDSYYGIDGIGGEETERDLTDYEVLSARIDEIVESLSRLADGEAVDKNFAAVVEALEAVTEGVQGDLKFFSDRLQETSSLSQAGWDHMVGIEKRTGVLEGRINDTDNRLAEAVTFGDEWGDSFEERLSALETLTDRIKATSLKKAKPVTA